MMTNKGLLQKIGMWGKRFAELQEHGKPIKPMTFEPMVCKHCGTRYEGNYCPRCGQSRVVSKITKRGFVSAFMEAYPQLASTFCRTILELLYRPGYMIRDYFRGHRVIYSGPFKTFLIIISIYVLFTNLTGVASQEENHFATFDATPAEIGVDAPKPKSKEAEVLARLKRFNQLDKDISQKTVIGPIWTIIKKKTQEEGSMYLFFCVPLLALAAKRAFRKANFDGRRLIYAEHFMIFTYLYAVNICFSLVFCAVNLLLSGEGSTSYPTLLILFYLVWTYKSIYGWHWRNTIRRMVPLAGWSLLLFVMACIVVVGTVVTVFLMV